MRGREVCVVVRVWVGAVRAVCFARGGGAGGRKASEAGVGGGGYGDIDPGGLLAAGYQLSWPALKFLIVDFRLLIENLAVPRLGVQSAIDNQQSTMAYWAVD